MEDGRHRPSLRECRRDSDGPRTSLRNPDGTVMAPARAACPERSRRARAYIELAWRMAFSVSFTAIAQR
jgi:hypothetical protein